MSHYLNPWLHSLRTHICVSRPPWVNVLTLMTAISHYRWNFIGPGLIMVTKIPLSPVTLNYILSCIKRTQVICKWIISMKNNGFYGCLKCLTVVISQTLTNGWMVEIFINTEKETGIQYIYIYIYINDYDMLPIIICWICKNYLVSY